MKKKMPISPVLLTLLGLLLALGVYVFSYFIPAQAEMLSLQAEVASTQSNAQMYHNYLSDASPLEREIAMLEQELAEMNATYTNESNVNFEISRAIMMYDVTLSSVSLDPTITYNGHKALPINLVISGEHGKVLEFIQHFEMHQTGSYLVQRVDMEVTVARTSASVLLYLCTPSV